MLYNAVLVPAVQQLELTICTHMSPPSWVSLQPLLFHPRSSRAPSWAPCDIQKLSTSYFTHSSVYMSMLFIMKNPSKVGIKGKFVNIIKSIYNITTSNIILRGEKLKTFPLRSGTWQKHPFSLPLSKTVLKVLFPHQSGKKTNFQAGKEEVKLSLIT